MLYGTGRINKGGRVGPDWVKIASYLNEKLGRNPKVNRVMCISRWLCHANPALASLKSRDEPWTPQEVAQTDTCYHHVVTL